MKIILKVIVSVFFILVLNSCFNKQEPFISPFYVNKNLQVKDIEKAGYVMPIEFYKRTFDVDITKFDHFFFEKIIKSDSIKKVYTYTVNPINKKILAKVNYISTYISKEELKNVLYRIPDLTIIKDYEFISNPDFGVPGDRLTVKNDAEEEFYVIYTDNGYYIVHPF